MSNKEIPKWLHDLCFRVTYIWKQIILIGKVDHVTINEYHKGQSIDWHVDSKSSGPIITVLSLKSDAIMGLKDVQGQEVQYPIPARSLVQMTDKERWDDKHCIYPVEDLRYSIVFRRGTK